MKQKLKCSDEWDWVSKRWRKLLHWQRGASKLIKRRLNKRIRKEGKNECK